MSQERLTARAALDVMRVPDRHGVYVLNAGREKRMTVHSQQVRAVSLIGALFETKALDKDSHLGIVGGGVGGVTAAVAALHLGVGRVCVFERHDRVLRHFGSSPRHIDPSLFDWPKARCRNPESELPFLAWKAATGIEVMKGLRQQWEIWEKLCHNLLVVIPRVDWLRVQAARALEDQPEPNRKHPQPAIRFRTDRGDERMQTFDAIVVASGFGPESQRVQDRDRENLAHTTYLQERNTRISAGKLLIMGRGDAALADAIAFGFEVKANKDDQGPLDERRLANLLRGMGEKFFAKDNQHLSHEEEDKFVETLVAQIEEKLSAEELVATGRLTTVASQKSPDYEFKENQAINRAFAKVLVKLDHLKLLGNADAEKVTRDESHLFHLHPNAATSGGGFPFLIERTGPIRAFQSDFRDLWQSYVDHGREEEKRDSGTFLAEGKPRTHKGGCVTLYSDLLDSATQRELFEKMANPHDKDKAYEERDHLNPFVMGVHGAIAQRISEKDGFSLVLSDNQVLDGLYFQALQNSRFKPQREELETWVKNSNLQFQFRTDNVDALLDLLVSNGSGQPKSFEFSSLVGGFPPEDSRSTLGRWMDKHPYPTWQAFSAAALPVSLFHGVVTRVKAVADWLRGKKVQALVPPICLERKSSLEDPGSFVLSLKSAAGRELAIAVYGEDNRSTVYKCLKKCRLDSSVPCAEVEAIRAWYDRAYGLAFARQRRVDAFETTHFGKGHWWARAGQKLSMLPTSEAQDARVARLAAGLAKELTLMGPYPVPDAHAPEIAVPSHVRLYKDGSIAFSLIEYLRDCSGVASHLRPNQQEARR